MEVSFRYLKRLELPTVPFEEQRSRGLLSNGKNQKAPAARALSFRLHLLLQHTLRSYQASANQEKAMKASVFALGGLMILSITSANAAPKAMAAPTTAASSVACSTSGAGFGSYPSGCRNGANFKTYNECKESGVKRGWRHEDMAWYCSGLGLQ